jgi:hypothetical protein
MSSAPRKTVPITKSEVRAQKKSFLYKILRLGLGCVVLASVIVITSVVFFYVDYYRTPKTKILSQGSNALWMRHQWVDTAQKPEQYEQLAAKLKAREITDIFVHVGPLNAQGLIEPEKYPQARHFISSLKQHYPELRIQAWIGQVEKKGGGPLDLDNQQVRQNIVTTSEIFLNLGFDGIHYNIEPIYSGDERILDLLHQTRVLTSTRSATLSLATDELAPFWEAERLVQQLRTRAAFWDVAYYRAIAEPVDQIAVMMYDTYLTEPWLFSQLVKWETRNLVPIIGDRATLFMGVPTYEDERIGFHPEAENMESGLKGIQQGIQPYSEEQLTHFGVALYAEWTTDDTEWEIYEQEWLGK